MSNPRESGRVRKAPVIFTHEIHVPKSRKREVVKESREFRMINCTSNNRWDIYRRKVKMLIANLRRDTHFFNVKTQDLRKNNNMVIDITSENDDILITYEAIKKSKYEIRDLLFAISDENKTHTRWPELVIADDEGLVELETVMCSVCNTGDKDDNDILICDHEGCLRAYHQTCLDPIQIDLPDEDEDWFCRQCQCYTDCLGEINECLLKSYQTHAEVFPELAVTKEDMKGNSIMNKDEFTPQTEQISSLNSIANLHNNLDVDALLGQYLVDNGDDDEDYEPDDEILASSTTANTTFATATEDEGEEERINDGNGDITVHNNGIESFRAEPSSSSSASVISKKRIKPENSNSYESKQENEGADSSDSHSDDDSDNSDDDSDSDDSGGSPLPSDVDSDIEEDEVAALLREAAEEPTTSDLYSSSSGNNNSSSNANGQVEVEAEPTVRRSRRAATVAVSSGISGHNSSSSSSSSSTPVHITPIFKIEEASSSSSSCLSSSALGERPRRNGSGNNASLSPSITTGANAAGIRLEIADVDMSDPNAPPLILRIHPRPNKVSASSVSGSGSGTGGNTRLEPEGNENDVGKPVAVVKRGITWIGNITAYIPPTTITMPITVPYPTTCATSVDDKSEMKEEVESEVQLITHTAIENASLSPMQLSVSEPVLEESIISTPTIHMAGDLPMSTFPTAINSDTTTTPTLTFPTVINSDTTTTSIPNAIVDDIDNVITCMDSNLSSVENMAELKDVIHQSVPLSSSSSSYSQAEISNESIVLPLSTNPPPPPHHHQLVSHALDHIINTVVGINSVTDFQTNSSSLSPYELSSTSTAEAITSIARHDSLNSSSMIKNEEVANVVDANLIVNKKRRRRRRSGITPSSILIDDDSHNDDDDDDDENAKVLTNHSLSAAAGEVVMTNTSTTTTGAKWEVTYTKGQGHVELLSRREVRYQLNYYRDNMESSWLFRRAALCNADEDEDDDDDDDDGEKEGEEHEEVDAIHQGNIVHTKRNRAQVDYEKLHQEAYGIVDDADDEDDEDVIFNHDDDDNNGKIHNSKRGRKAEKRKNDDDDDDDDDDDKKSRNKRKRGRKRKNNDNDDDDDDDDKKSRNKRKRGRKATGIRSNANQMKTSTTTGEEAVAATATEFKKKETRGRPRKKPLEPNSSSSSSPPLLPPSSSSSPLSSSPLPLLSSSSSSSPLPPSSSSMPSSSLPSSSSSSSSSLPLPSSSSSPLPLPSSSLSASSPLPASSSSSPSSSLPPSSLPLPSSSYPSFVSSDDVNNNLVGDVDHNSNNYDTNDTNSSAMIEVIETSHDELKVSDNEIRSLPMMNSSDTVLIE